MTPHSPSARSDGERVVFLAMSAIRPRLCSVHIPSLSHTPASRGILFQTASNKTDVFYSTWRARSPPRTVPRLLLSRLRYAQAIQSLLQVGQDVIDMLDPDRQPDIAGGDTGRHLLFLVELGMGRAGGMNRQRPRVTDIGHVVDHLQRVDELPPRLDAAGIPYVELRGDTRDRAEPVRSFQAGEVPLFLISLKAGGRGLNLTAADTVIHYDPWWNPAVEDQATDRAHRIGQDRPVQVHRLIAEGTLEDHIATLIERKRSLAEAVVGGGESWIGRLTNEDLTDLVRLGSGA